MKNDNALGVAILGFGFIGKVHAYGHINLPLFYSPPPVRTKIVGVATSNTATAAQAKAMLGCQVATTDQLSLIARQDVDIVHICTPNDLHAEALLAAMAANKHIYCDKPLTAICTACTIFSTRSPRTNPGILTWAWESTYSVN